MLADEEGGLIFKVVNNGFGGGEGGVGEGDWERM